MPIDSRNDRDDDKMATWRTASNGIRRRQLRTSRITASPSMRPPRSFGDLLAMNMPDPDHSEGEQRFLVLGMSGASRLLVVSYAERPPRTRVISARLATGPERRKYENN